MKQTDFLIIIIVFLSACSMGNDYNIRQSMKIDMYYGFGNEINTFDKKLKKNLGPEGFVTTDFQFNVEEQFIIEEKMYVIDFILLPDTIKIAQSDTTVTIDPDPGVQFLRIKNEEIDKTVCWFYPLPDTQQAQDLLSLVNLIIDITKSKKEYLDLPEGYYPL